MSNFVVQTEEFEGPIEKLLNLIEERKLFVNDISLAQVTDDYIGYVQTLEQSNIDDIAEFIVIASTLILIKSKSLLPDLNLTEEEESSIDDLEDRLAKYKQIRYLSQYVRSAFGKNIIFDRRESGHEEVYFAPGKNLTSEELRVAAHHLIEQLPTPRSRPTARVKKVMRLEDVIEKLRKRIKSKLEMSFHEFAKTQERPRESVIVSFLALLELVKEGVIEAEQNRNFDDISVHSQEVGLPEYH